MSEQYFLSADRLTRSFDSIKALSEVTLGVKEDELLVVVGPTSAGKTTLLRSLCGLDPVEGGRVLLAGQDVTHQSPAERDLAMVFQNFSLYPRWTVRQNLSFPLKAPGRRLAQGEIDKRVNQAAEMLKITHLLGRPAARLSGGEMQRVAIGRATVREPRAYLMDEPLTNLDAKLRESLRVELVELRRRSGRPMIFVTHDQAEALSMADRIVVLDSGRILQTGLPQDVYERPVSPRVAVQLGQPRINLLTATPQDGHLYGPGGVDLGEAPASINIKDQVSWVDMRSSKADATAYTCGIRPEHLLLTGGKQPAKVTAVHYMGATTALQARWGDTDVNLSVEGTTDRQVGDRIHPSVVSAILWNQEV